MAHHQKVRSLDVAVTAKGGGPGVFLQLAEGLAGLPALEMLKIMAPFGRNSGIMQVWMEQAFQVGCAPANALGGARLIQEVWPLTWNALMKALGLP